MNKRYSTLALLLCGVGLSACGGGALCSVAVSVASGGCGGSSSGGSVSTGNTVPTSTQVTFASLQAEGVALINANNALAQTPSANVPTSGVATYSGVGAFGTGTGTAIVNDPSSLGQITLNADFANSALSGAITNFRAPDGTEFSGTLAVANGTVSSTGLDGNIQGTLTEPGGQFTYTGTFSGTFLGTQANSILGTGSARRVGPGSDSQVNGVFLADQG